MVVISPRSKFYLSQYLGLISSILLRLITDTICSGQATSTTLSNSLDNFTSKKVPQKPPIHLSMAISHLGLGGLGRPCKACLTVDGRPLTESRLPPELHPVSPPDPKKRRATFSSTLSASPPCLHTSSSVNLSLKM